MNFEKYLLSLAKRIAGASGVKKVSHYVMEEHQATLMTANSKTYKWLLEYAAQAPAPVPAKTPLVSIMMPTWNREDVIERAIESVLKQHYQNWELIVIDDGSADGTRSRLEKCAADKRIHYIYQDHRNSSAARNAGLATSKGEIVAYLDTDVVWFPGYLSNIVAAYVDDEDLDAVYTAQLVEDPDKQFSYVRCEEFDYDELCRDNFIDVNVFSHRRRLYEREGGFDKNLARLNDWDLVRRYTKNCKIRRVLTLGGAYTHGRTDQITRTRSRNHSLYLIEAKDRRPADSPLRVLYAVWHYPQLSESYVRTEIRGVRQLGVEVEVWSEEGVAAPFESEVPVRRGDFSEAIAQFKPDLIHTHWLHMAEKFGPLMKKANLPLTVRGHGFEFSTEIVSRLDKNKQVHGVYIFPHHADRCRSTSRKVRPMQVAFDPELYYPCEEKDRRLVMRTGCALPTKDYATFFEIARLCPDHHFLLVLCRAYLKEDYLDEVIRMNREFGDPVEIKINVQHEELSQLMRRAGIYVHTANPNEPFGMPISISEAMATGSYIIGRQLPPSALYIGEAGKLYNTPEEAANLIHETTKWNDSEWNRIHMNSIDRAFGNFANVKVLQPLVDHWRSLTK